MEAQSNRTKSWVWIVLVVAIIVSLGCGLIFGCIGGFLIGTRTSQNAWNDEYAYEYLPEQEQVTPQMPQMPDLMPRLPDVQSAAMVVSVSWDSPAADAGIMRGDLITAVNGEPLSTESSLADMIQSYKPGQTVELTVWRAAEENTLTLDVTLGEQRDAQGTVIAYLGIRYTTIVQGE